MQPAGMSQGSTAHGREGRGRGSCSAAAGAEPHPERERLASGAGQVMFVVNADEMERANEAPTRTIACLPHVEYYKTQHPQWRKLRPIDLASSCSHAARLWLAVAGRRRLRAAFGTRMRVVRHRDAPSTETGGTMIGAGAGACRRSDGTAPRKRVGRGRPWRPGRQALPALLG